jgi:small subunit ribosomal protein S6
MNRYETVFILTPVLSEEQAKEAVKSVVSDIKGAKGKVINEESWGLKKLAYPIQKKTTGFYFLIEFESDPTFIAKMETEFKRDEKVMRFLTMRMDTDHIAWAEKRKSRMKEAKA